MAGHVRNIYGQQLYNLFKIMILLESWKVIMLTVNTSSTRLHTALVVPDNSYASSLETMARVLQWILFTIVCQSIVLFGIGTNIINIICFVKQTFKDPVNISLFGTLYVFCNPHALFHRIYRQLLSVNVIISLIESIDRAITHVWVP